MSVVNSKTILLDLSAVRADLAELLGSCKVFVWAWDILKLKSSAVCQLMADLLPKDLHWLEICIHSAYATLELMAAGSLHQAQNVSLMSSTCHLQGSTCSPDRP